MNKEEFKRRWELNDDGDGITWEEIAECAKAWGLFSRPKCAPMKAVRYRVLKYADVSDAEEYNPDEYGEECEQ